MALLYSSTSPPSQLPTFAMGTITNYQYITVTMTMKITTKPHLRVNTVEETGQKLPIFSQMSIMNMVHGRAGLARYYKVLRGITRYYKVLQSLSKWWWWYPSFTYTLSPLFQWGHFAPPVTIYNHTRKVSKTYKGKGSTQYYRMIWLFLVGIYALHHAKKSALHNATNVRSNRKNWLTIADFLTFGDTCLVDWMRRLLTIVDIVVKFCFKSSSYLQV